MIDPIFAVTRLLESLPITASDPMGKQIVYETRISCGLGDLLDIRGQIEVTNDAGEVAMVGACILVDGKRPPGSKPLTINVTPEMHHCPLQPHAVSVTGKMGLVTVQLQAWSYSTPARAAGRALTVEDMGGLTILRHTA